MIMLKAVVDKLPTGIHLQRCESQKKFVAAICGDNAKETSVRCVEFIVNEVLELYEQYMKGKAFHTV